MRENGRADSRESAHPSLLAPLRLCSLPENNTSAFPLVSVRAPGKKRLRVEKKLETVDENPVRLSRTSPDTPLNSPHERAVFTPSNLPVMHVRNVNAGHNSQSDVVLDRACTTIFPPASGHHSRRAHVTRGAPQRERDVAPIRAFARGEKPGTAS